MTVIVPAGGRPEVEAVSRRRDFGLADVERQAGIGAVFSPTGYAVDQCRSGAKVADRQRAVGGDCGCIEVPDTSRAPRGRPSVVRTGSCS